MKGRGIGGKHDHTIIDMCEIHKNKNEKLFILYLNLFVWDFPNKNTNV